MTTNTIESSPSLNFDRIVTRWSSATERLLSDLNLPNIVEEKLTGLSEAALHRALDARDHMVRWLGGIPRLERDVAPANAESNDVYQFRMSSVYLAECPKKEGTFVMYYRNPKDIGGVVLDGIEHALDTIQNFKFDPRFLKNILDRNLITPELYQKLLTLDHFDVTVDAIPEGTFIGPNTPVMTISGPLWQVQLLETVLLACIDYPTGVATRNAAIIQAAGGKPLINFGARRAPGEQAAILADFASIKGGAVGVSNTLSAYLSDRLDHEESFPAIGTTAHSFTESYFLFDSHGNPLKDPVQAEEDAYNDWIKYFPENTTVLIDTIDKQVGLRTAVKLFEKLNMRAQGRKIGVRDDSMISADSVIMVYETLQALGLETDDFYLVLSDNLTPSKVKDIHDGVTKKRSENFWEQMDIRLGVGTYLNRPEPVGFVLKLAGIKPTPTSRTIPVSKRSGSTSKASFPTATPYRIENHEHYSSEDVNLAPDEDPKKVEHRIGRTLRRLDRRSIEHGNRTTLREAATKIRERARAEIAKVPVTVKTLHSQTHRVGFSPQLDEVRKNIQEALKAAGERAA